MGTSYGDFIKYPRTPHLFGSKGTDDDKQLDERESTRFIADDSLIVEEKIDGTNVGIHFSDDGEMVLQCRGHLITEGMHPQYDLFKQWVVVKRRVLEERLENRFILFGEWVYARHSIHYLELAHYFFEFDTRGRNTDSMSRPEENLHFWKLASEEHGCFDQSYAFANEQARFLFFRQMEPNLYYVPHEDFVCTVTMISGLPGSGKDTWLSRHRRELPVVSMDDIRGELDVDPTGNQGEVVQLARERCREYLRLGTDFAFNATNLLKLTRQRWIDLFADYRARIELVYVEPPFDRLLRQNKNRDNCVPTEIVRKLAAKCEPPTWTECHSLTLMDGD